MNPQLPDPLAPQTLGHALALHADFYRGEAMLERDRTAVFACSWQLVGHESALANADSWPTSCQLHANTAVRSRSSIASPR